MDITIIRSQKRRKTVSARIVDGTILVQAPARMSERALGPIVDKLSKSLNRRANRASSNSIDLDRLAHDLNRHYFEGVLTWSTIAWVANQEKSRWGSCTPAKGTIRLSDRLKAAPPFVITYVLFHEMAHLIEPNHSKAFWRLVERYPRAERARGFLMAFGGSADQY